MARPRLSICLLAIVPLLLAAPPALAQFGSIFRDEPPRPPADVPGAPPPPPPIFPASRRAISPEAMCRAPPGDIRSDQPPAQPLPAPMSLPPSSRPGGGTIQSQPLPPPPGGVVAPQPPAQEQPQQGADRGPAQPLPGLPPGVRQPRGAPPQPADTAPQPGDEVVVEPPPQRITNPTAVFSGLDKITGRIISFDVAINETVQFGALQVTPRVCYSRPPTETPNTDSFVEVDEVTLQGEIKRIFTGWMFAASPGLHAVEHPIYDVWITDCKGGQNPKVAEAPADADAQATGAHAAATAAAAPAPAAAAAGVPAAVPLAHALTIVAQALDRLRAADRAVERERAEIGLALDRVLQHAGDSAASALRRRRRSSGDR